MEPGQRLATVAFYSEKFDLGRGTIQSALNYLEEQGAVQLERRGHLGTQITAIDYKKLWLNGGARSVTGVMPLPYSRRYEGLATGLYQVFRTAGLPFNLAYMRGSSNRIESLKRQQYDFAVISKLAAEENSSEVEPVIEFGPQSYVSGHRVLFASGDETQIRDGMRVGIDNSSADHVVLTKTECAGHNVELVEMPYSQVIRSLLTRRIDAAIWNVDEVIERGYPITYCNLSSKEACHLDDRGTVAVVVVRRNNRAISNLLRTVIDVDKVLELQRLVLDEKLLPNY
ncbi:MAG: hypothetical protein IMF26_04880 [Candidatus Fermentithermobacillus carboniphilus]|uniref:HTH gntR-type domain-containing protein n=1 Tax=Candidatus Fermentithermobacillus carboniphilus TaxID=3085328 RepID=A0AAT9LEX0_9FIRM|nr:MAG: hypothetical protein IMF26_04880 [Candidatus Fermentithermobacillus carboniphilus]